MSKRKLTESASKQRTDLTLEQKSEVLKEIDKKTPYRVIAEKINIAKGTVANIKASKEEIESEAQNPTNLKLRAKAKFFANSLGYPEFGASDGWLAKFHDRHGISSQVLSI